MKKKYILPILLFPLLAGCELIGPITPSDPTPVDPEPSDPVDPVDPVDPTPSTGYDYKIVEPSFTCPTRSKKDDFMYTDLFNLSNKVDIRIDIDRSELQKINDDNHYEGDYASNKPETYHLAKKVTINIVNNGNTFSWEYENVGIRQKGNTSRRRIFNGDNVSNQNHFKLSFDETFTDTSMYSSDFISTYGNASYDDRDFLGLTGLDIKWNKVDDSTHLKEIYSNMILINSGVLAQHIGLSTMKMYYDTDKVADFGLCTIYEPTNKSLIKRSLQSDTKYIGMSNWKTESKGTYGVPDKKYGDYYKASYGKGNGGSEKGASFLPESITGKRLGVKTDIQGYNIPTYERKTNTSEEYNDTLMRDLVALVNNNNTTYEQIASKVDLDYLAMEEAVMYFLGNPDSMKYNYNNYMIYFRRVDSKAVIIPIDNDRCLGVGHEWRDGLNFVLSAKPLSRNNLRSNQENQLLLKTVINVNVETDAKKAYRACLELLRNSTWLKNETFEAYYNILKETYKGLSNFSLDGGNDNISFSDYMSQKKALYDNNK